MRGGFVAKSVGLAGPFMDKLCNRSKTHLSPAPSSRASACSNALRTMTSGVTLWRRASRSRRSASGSGRLTVTVFMGAKVRKREKTWQAPPAMVKRSAAAFGFRLAHGRQPATVLPPHIHPGKLASPRDTKH